MNPRRHWRKIAIVKAAPGVFCALVTALGCGGPNDSFGDPFNNPGISSQRLSGTISGQPWSFRTGDAALARGTGALQYLANLYGDTREPCKAFGLRIDTNVITFVVPTAPGYYALSLDLPVEIKTTDFDVALIEGDLAIDSITATTISGGLKIRTGGAGQSINGRFDAVICP